MTGIVSSPSHAIGTCTVRDLVFSTLISNITTLLITAILWICRWATSCLPALTQTELKSDRYCHPKKQELENLNFTTIDMDMCV
jgi:hypothetical protein